MPGPIPEGKLVYGMQLPVQSQSTIYAEAWEADAGTAELSDIARAADRSGFHYVAVCDHVAIPRPLDEKMNTSWWDTIATLGYLAAVTEHTHLLSHVYVLPYRHPLMAAKAFLTLDELSGGRAILGVGAGHVEAEFDLLGVSFAERGRLLDESIEVVRAAFTDEYPAVDHRALPGGRRRARDPGGRSPGDRPSGWEDRRRPALRRAADLGDGWLPQGPPEGGMKRAIAWLDERRQANGRADRPFAVGVNAEILYLGDPWFETGPFHLTGDPEPMADRLRRYRDIGVDQLQIRFRSRSAAELCDQIDRFGADVAPLLDA